MFYHNILHDDMRNGEGLRVVLFVSGCNHRCKGCQNPQTWDVCSGIPFDEFAKEEIFEQLSKDYISGITFSGGDPLNESNLYEIYNLILDIKLKFPNKNIWLYTGFKWEEIFYTAVTDGFDPIRDLRKLIVEMCNVLVDDRFVEELADINYHWAGSTNQRVIDIQKSLQENKIILYEQRAKCNI